MTKTSILIPSRLNAKRLPSKPLLKINGISIIQHVYHRAKESKVGEVIVATGDKEIAEEIKSIKGEVILTKKNHLTGTDRIYEALEILDNKNKPDYVINLQGDEPFIDRFSIKELLNGFNDKKVQMASLMRDFKDKNELNDSNNVKVIIDKDNYSINFSRVPMNSHSDNYKHIGVYAFRKETLIEFSKMEKTMMEKMEKIECLRYIENGKKIKMFKTDFSTISIDTPEDLIKAEEYLKRQ